MAEPVNAFHSIQTDKPVQHINALIGPLSCDRRVTVFDAGTQKPFPHISEHVGPSIVVLEGGFEIRRTDGLVLVRGGGPYVLGLGEALYGRGRHTIYCTTALNIVSLSKEEAFEIVDKESLWSHVANLLAWQLQLVVARDEELTSVDAYTMIRAKLSELYMLKTQFGLSFNIVDFIQQRTNLSRSIIHQVISELKRGEYITIVRGRLVDMKSSLPQKY